MEHTPDRPAAIPAGPAAGLPNRRRLRPGQLVALKQSLLGVLRQELFAPGSTGEQLWEHGLVSRMLADGSLGARTTCESRWAPQIPLKLSQRLALRDLRI